MNCPTCLEQILNKTELKIMQHRSKHIYLNCGTLQEELEQKNYYKWHRVTGCCYNALGPSRCASTSSCLLSHHLPCMLCQLMFLTACSWEYHHHSNNPWIMKQKKILTFTLTFCTHIFKLFSQHFFVSKFDLQTHLK